jgi:hypothetical protein
VEGDLQKAEGRNLRTYRQEEVLSHEAFGDVLGVHRTDMGGSSAGSAT